MLVNCPTYILSYIFSTSGVCVYIHVCARGVGAKGYHSLRATHLGCVCVLINCYYTICLCNSFVYVCAHATGHARVEEKTTCSHQFSPPTLWIPGIKHRLSVLVANPFNYFTISLVPSLAFLRQSVSLAWDSSVKLN